MCTSVSLKSLDHKYLLARTMDFSYDLDPDFLVFPRYLSIKFENFPTSLDVHYAFMGLGKNIGEYQLADGINEHGLTIAALYFEGEAEYSVKTDTEISIAAHEMVKYALAVCKDTDEVIDVFHRIPITASKVEFLGLVPPLHWVVQDMKGNAKIVEMTHRGLQIYDNKIGVLTNSPSYDWHLTNVRNYIRLDPVQVQPRVLYGQEFKAFGQGSGTFGLPGDFTSPSRFIKTLYNKLSADVASNKEELVILASHILNAVDISKGNVITQRNSIDYTQYTAYMINSTQTYCYRLYTSLSIKEYKMEDFDLDGKQLYSLKT